MLVPFEGVFVERKEVSDAQKIIDGTDTPEVVNYYTDEVFVETSAIIAIHAAKNEELEGSLCTFKLATGEEYLMKINAREAVEIINKKKIF
jgi:hypothetical protein